MACRTLVYFYSSSHLSGLPKMLHKCPPCARRWLLAGRASDLPSVLNSGLLSTNLLPALVHGMAVNV